MSDRAKKRVFRSLEEKYSIIKAYLRVQNETGAKTNVVRQFNLPSLSSLNTILEKKEAIIAKFESNLSSTSRKKLATGTNLQLDERLYSWFLRMRSNKVEISGDDIIQQAKIIAEDLNIADFVGSRGFLQRFKDRYNIKFKKLHGEGGRVEEGTIGGWRVVLKGLIESYRPEDVYNWDETGLIFAKGRETSFVTGQEAADRSLRGHRSSKQRVTILVGASMTGEKMPLIMIGKSERPRAFKNVPNLPVTYFNQKKAWMDSTIFAKILKNFDRSMRMQKRKVLLFLDNCSAHPEITLEHVEVKYFPPNTTSRCQPMDMGIIKCLKSHYKNEISRRRAIALSFDATSTPVNLL